MKPGARWRPIVAAALAALAVAAVGGLITDIGPWYLGLEQPAWKPPDAAFGPAWTTIFAFAAAAGARAWRDAPSRGARQALLSMFGLNAVLNVAWSLLFFKLHRPDWSLAEVPLLWASIALLMAATRRYSTLAAALLLPYLLWVSFAAVLNLAVVRLNGPFTGA